jgi:hypothetical protein
MRTTLFIKACGALTGCSKSNPSPDASPQNANATVLPPPSRVVSIRQKGHELKSYATVQPL